MDTLTINNLISFVAMALTEGNEDMAIKAAKGLDIPEEIKEHTINVLSACFSHQPF